jgi:biopolymer transport protein ExbD
VIFLMLGALLPTPGIRLQPPTADNLPGVDRRPWRWPWMKSGTCILKTKWSPSQLKTSFLAAPAKSAREPLTLIIHADKAVSYDQLAHLELDTNPPAIGITNLLLATLPRPEAAARP